MHSVTVNQVPEELYQQLLQAAHSNGRTLNCELLNALQLAMNLHEQREQRIATSRLLSPHQRSPKLPAKVLKAAMQEAQER